MKISVNDVRPGQVLEHQAKLWRVVKTEHVKPGKGPAYLQVELKGVDHPTKLNERLRTADTIERVRLDETDYQFLYDDGDQLHFMNQESFEQVTLDRSLLGDRADYLQEGMVVTVRSYDGQPLFVSIPDTVALEVVEADPVVKGQTAASSYKPARLENGLRVMVPPHIERGSRIVVNTNDGSYVARAKD